MLDSLCERRASASTPTDSAVAEKAHIVRSGAEELDKRGRTWVTPMPALATDALLPEQKKNPAIGAGLLFPSRKNPSRPITSHLAGYWLKRAFEIGTLPKPAGTLWHGFRRKRATDRRHFPLKDVATAGGWRDVQTMITSISSPDSETMRAVVDLAKPPDRASGC